MTDHTASLRPVAVVGPTGSGKSETALALAESTGGEVVNIDSMQLYAGMDIGTAKLPVEQRRGIVHHQLDVLDVTQPASVARYRDAAIADIESILAGGRRPVIVGGSMMYIQALLDMWDIPPTSPDVRARWQRRLDRDGAAALHAVLADNDGDAADVIEVNDGRRIVRALEVIELTGRPFAASQPPKDRPTRWGTTMIGLSASPEWLNPRLEHRVHRMFEHGLVDEVRALQDRGLSRDSTAGKAIGYAQVLDYLAGELSYADAVDRTISGTRRYARRQRAWFRRDPRIWWFDAAAPDVAMDVVSAIDG